MSPLTLHLIREAIKDMKATRKAAAVELEANSAPRGAIRGTLFAIDRDIERLEEDLETLEFMHSPQEMEAEASLYLPGFH